MSAYALERAAACRFALRMRGVAGIPGDVQRLAELLGPAITIIRAAPETPASCAMRRDGGARITLPRSADDRADALRLLEEIAHWLCRSGFARPPGDAGTPTEIREEAEAREFCDAWRIPDRVIEELRRAPGRMDDLVEAGIEPEMIERVCRRMERRPAPRLLDPPPWSAFRSCQAQIETGGRAGILVTDGVGRRYSLPGTDAATAGRLLGALRVEEVGLVLEHHRVGLLPGLLWQELRDEEDDDHRDKQRPRPRGRESDGMRRR